MKRVAPTLIAVFVLAVIGVLSGCGGNSINFSAWAASYSGSGTLDNTKSGVVALTCGTDGLVTGTLTVTGADGTENIFKFTAGTYDLTGSITSTSGGFEVHGNVPNNGDFFIRGHFPVDSSSKPYAVVTGTSTTFPHSYSYTGNLTRN